MDNYEVSERLASNVGDELSVYPELLKILLLNRGIKSREEAENFLRPDYNKHLHDPFLFKDMAKAVDRIIKAVNENEKIVIWSDYDADGIPGGIILHDFFTKIQFYSFEIHIPDRNNEGFGLNEKTINRLADDGVSLIITVDCGIGNVTEVDLANKKGIDVIITDHHMPSEKLPPALAIINSKQENCGYQFKDLCGAGVAFKLVQALTVRIGASEHSSKLNPGWEKWLLDMAGVATISDMVPLRGENRAISYYGLMVLRKTPRVGLGRLFQDLKIQRKHLTEDDIGFSISPRINVSPHMGSAMDAFRLLTTRDETEAGMLSSEMTKLNNERKGLVAAMIKEIKNNLGKGEKSRHDIIVMGNPTWKPSLLGLAANTLTSEYECPVFLWGRGSEEDLKGSCRSRNTNLIALMGNVTPGVLAEFGGHFFSGGFSVRHDKIHHLESELRKSHELVKNADDAKEKTVIDAKASLETVSWENWEMISRLAPFGMGNPKPVFLFVNIEIYKIEEFGKEKNHIKLLFKKNNSEYVTAISFFTGRNSFSREPREGESINLVASMEKSVFRNFPELRLRIVDII